MIAPSAMCFAFTLVIEMRPIACLRFRRCRRAGGGGPKISFNRLRPAPRRPSRDAAESCQRPSPPALRIKNKIDKAVSIVDLYLQHPQHDETQDAGNLSTNRVTDSLCIERHNILMRLTQMTELQRHLISAKHVFHRSAHALNDSVRVRRYVCYLPGGCWSNRVVECAGIDEKELRAFVIYLRMNE